MLLQCVRTDSINASEVRVMAAHSNVHIGPGPRRSQFCTMTPGAQKLGLERPGHQLHGYSVALIANIVVMDTITGHIDERIARRGAQSKQVPLSPTRAAWTRRYSLARPDGEAYSCARPFLFGQ
jgi:hypothetical protein